MFWKKVFKMNFFKKIAIKNKIKKKFSEIFKYGKKNKKKNNIVLLEFGNSAFNHIASAYLCDMISKKFRSKIVAYPGYQLLTTELSLGFFKSFKWIVGNLLSLGTFGLHHSFGVQKIIWPKINSITEIKASKKFSSYSKDIRSKEDLENYTIDNILIGDLIYDSYLKKYLVETVNINSHEFKSFFLNSLRLFYFWQKYFYNNRIKALVVYHSVYVSALALRVALKKKIPAYVFNNEKLYQLSENRKFYGLEYLDYKKIFQSLKEKKKIISLSKKKLIEKFNGKLSSDLVYISKSAYGKSKKLSVLKKSKKLKVLIAPHSVSDSPHHNGNNFFTDQYEWLEFLGKISNETNYDWYIKCHPDFATYFDNTVDLVKKFSKRYPKINYLKGTTSHNQLIKEGINFVLTIFGTIAGEYPYFNINALNATKNNPYCKYNFAITPKNKNEYIKVIKNLEAQQSKIKKKEVLEHYYMRNEYFNNRWFFNDLNKVKHEIKNYKNFTRYPMYQYWLKHFNHQEHSVKYEKINRFINSKDYIFINQ